MHAMLCGIAQTSTDYPIPRILLGCLILRVQVEVWFRRISCITCVSQPPNPAQWTFASFNPRLVYTFVKSNGHPFAFPAPVFSLTNSVVNFISCSCNCTSLLISLPFSTTAGGHIYSPLPLCTVAAYIVLCAPSNWSFLNGSNTVLTPYPMMGNGSWISCVLCFVDTNPGWLALTSKCGFLEVMCLLHQRA